MNSVRTNYGTTEDAVLGDSTSGSRSYRYYYPGGSKKSGNAVDGGESYALRSLGSDSRAAKAKAKAQAGWRGRDPYSVTTALDDENGGGNDGGGDGNEAGRDLFQPPGLGTTVTMAERHPVGDCHDASSVGSDGSTRMIIRKQVGYSVQHTPTTEPI